MRVVHCKRSQYTHYIGRPGVFGNPFIIGRDGTRAEVIKKYEVLARSPLRGAAIREAIKTLPADAVLGCWCSPQPCHGDIIIKLWKEAH